MTLRVWRSHPTEWRLFLTVWLVYLFHLAPLTGANENRYLDLVRSIIDERRFEIDTYHYNTIDKSYTQSHYYAGAAPGPAFLAIPAYLLFRLVEPVLPGTLFDQYDKATYIRGYLKGGSAPDEFVIGYPFDRFLLSHLVITGLTCSLLSALTAALIYRCATQLNGNGRANLWVALTYAFGTISFFYAVRLYAHALSTFCLFWSFTLSRPFTSDARPGQSRLFWSGVATGMAVLMDYTAGPMAVVLVVYLCWTAKGRAVSYPILGMAIPMVLLLWYQGQCFGHPLATPYGLPTDPTGYGSHAEYREGLHGFSLPSLSRLWDLSFSLYRGMFVYMPIIAVAVYGLLRQVWQRRRSHAPAWMLVAVLCVVQVLFTATMRYWYGGWEFGPRYLTPMLPFLLLALAPVLVTSWRVVVLGVVWLSMFINWVGVQYGPVDSPVGGLVLFLLSGPTTPLYHFLSTYFHASGSWKVGVSPVGGYLIVGGLIVWLWESWQKDGEYQVVQSV